MKSWVIGLVITGLLSAGGTVFFLSQQKQAYNNGYKACEANHTEARNAAAKKYQEIVDQAQQATTDPAAVDATFNRLYGGQFTDKDTVCRQLCADNTGPEQGLSEPGVESPVDTGQDSEEQHLFCAGQSRTIEAYKRCRELVK